MNRLTERQKTRVLRFQTVRETQQDEIQRERARFLKIGRQTEEARNSGKNSFGESAMPKSSSRTRFFLTDGYDSETDSFWY